MAMSKPEPTFPWAAQWAACARLWRRDWPSLAERVNRDGGR